MFATLMKILPVLWPFFKEMVLGGKKEIEAADRPNRLKALFYIISFLIISLGYGGYETFKLIQKLHAAELSNASLTEQYRGANSVIANLTSERDGYKRLSDDRSERVKELRDQQDNLIRQLAKSESDLQNSQAEIKRIIDEKAELESKLAVAEKAARNLDTFRTTPQTPRRLIRHNQAVDVLKQLQEDTANEASR